MYYNIKDMKDTSKAKELFEQAAQKGDKESLTLLGNIYRFGYTGEANLEKAQECYEQAVKLGDEYAKEALKNIKQIKELENLKKEIKQNLNELHEKTDDPTWFPREDTEEPWFLQGESEEKTR